MRNNRFTDLFAEADAAFDGKYKDQLNKLMALSKEEIDAVVPGTEDLRVYNLLVKVVENASRNNLSQAQLAEDINALGGVAVKIAKRITGLSSLL
jgi:hypothetical protein